MQSKNKDDSVQLSSRYQQYDFAKRHLRKQGRGKVFPFGKGNENDTIQQSGKKNQTSQCLTATYYKGGKGTHIKPITSGSQAQRVYGTEGLAITQKALGGGQGAKTGLYAIPVLSPDRPIKRQNGRRFKEDGDPSFTLTGQDRHGVSDGMRIRRLTPIECERLQGFPDGWTEEGIQSGELVSISDTQRYKMLGNAVTTNVVKAIMEKLL